MSGEELRAALAVIRSHVLPIGNDLSYSRGWEAARSSIEREVAALAAPSTPEPSGHHAEYDMDAEEAMRDILGRLHVGGRHPADLSWLATNGIHVLDALRAAPSTPEPSDLVRDAYSAGYVDAAENARRAAPSTEPALDADQQFTAVDKSLLATFQWSDKDYKRFGLAASAFLSHLHDIGWDVTVSDPEKAAEYARLAESQP